MFRLTLRGELAVFTLGQAAKEAGVSKTSLHRAVKSGRVSASRNDDGTFSIDPAELFRVYPRNSGTQGRDVPVEQTVTASGTDGTAERIALAARLAVLESQAEMQAERIAELKEQRDSWQRQAEQAQRLLAAPPPPPTTAPDPVITPEPVPAKRRGFFARLLG